MNEPFWEFSYRIWLSGGILMIPLFFLAALVFANCVQLFFYMSKQNLSDATQEELIRYIREPEKAPRNYARILRYVTDSEWTEDVITARFNEAYIAILAIVDRRIKYLNTLVASAPLMGLLGTVIGMLVTFSGLANSGGETVDVVAGGISQALITTQTGLMIALPGLFVVLIVQRRKHKLEAAFSKLRSMTLATLTTT